MEKACGNSACRNTFICHNDKKKFCSNRCYPSVIARAAAKQASRNGALAGAANCASLDTVRTTPAQTPAPTYYETPDDTSTRKTRDDSWIPSPHSGCSPPTARFGRPRRDPAPSTVTQTACIAGVNVSLPALSPPQARPFSTPTSRSPRPPSIVQPTRVSHGDLDDQHLALPSPLFPSDTTPPPFSDASSSSFESSFDDLDGGVLEDEDALSPADLFYERWAPTILNCSSRTELDTIASDLATNWHALTLKEDTPSSEATRPPRIPQTTPPGSIPHRQQSRQQQRVRRKNNAKRWAAASKLQALFKRYPKRAVRKVLGETSQSYTGSSEAATLFLKTTYEKPRPPPDDILVARAAYDECLWTPPSDDDLSLLSLPPSRQEIAYKLKRASNTSPGADGVEYKDIQRLDPSGRLLEVLYAAVWLYGIPTCWKSARTIPVYKKGSPDDYANFRPISLLSTIYKLFSSSIATRLTTVASNCDWLSPEQKGFLPGVHGIQEHTMLLESAIEEAKLKKSNLTICWLDLANAFGSLPHDFLHQLFASLPIPTVLRDLLSDIYTDSIFQFVVGRELITVHPTSGVRQGDGLSSIIFNLAAEPLIRCAKAPSNSGFPLFCSMLKATAYADDVSLIGTTPEQLQPVLDAMLVVAAKLGLRFNVGKCSFLAISKGKATHSTHLTIHGTSLRGLEEGETESYLGVPLGTRLTFRPVSDLPDKLTKLADCDLAPWQKLEVFRAHLLPSLSHHLATGRVLRGFLGEMDARCSEFLRFVSNVPHTAHNGFLYSDRRAGGLGASQLAKDSDIWIIARATQLLDSNDPVVRLTARAQLSQNISRGFNGKPPDPLPLSNYLSGSVEGGLHDTRFYKCGSNTWSRARKSARRLEVRIDVSGDESTKVIADDVSCLSLKAVRGLRSVIRKRWTISLTNALHQGRVARGLLLDPSNDVARLSSHRTCLSFNEWNLIHKSRLGLLPLLGNPGCSAPNTKCRRCKVDAETTSHVTSHCRSNLPAIGRRHDLVLAEIVKTITRAGHAASVNRVFPGSTLRPDIVIPSTDPPTIIDLTITFDAPESLDAGHARKIEKYSCLGLTLPFVIGALGSWLPSNNAVAVALNIPPAPWRRLRRKCRLMAIQGSVSIIHRHIHGHGDDQEANIPAP
ncbi:uncharacterized protein LOC124311947 [Daphnia pulicaria]|uniref:uncharacterized protein LOC124311947 n=1 Tax=Daphnia pulicaria TaxID=35523 RepID=UPI001EEA7664|nr:uncharacterized protein LOC124311947 [Daphnia pulicaria]